MSYIPQITSDYKREAKNKEARQRIRGKRDIWRIYPSLLQDFVYSL